MFNIGIPELVIILGIALLVVGPKRLPELAKSLGKGFREFRKTSDGIKDSFQNIEAQDTPMKLTPISKGNGNGNRNPGTTES